MSEMQDAERPRGPSPSLFLYAAASAVLLLGIIGAASVGSSYKCPPGYYPSAQTCVQPTMNVGTSGAVDAAPAGTKDWKLAVRAEILLWSLAVALVIGSFGARAYRRERAGPT